MDDENTNYTYTYYYDPHAFYFYYLDVSYSFFTVLCTEVSLRVCATGLVAFFGVIANCINIVIFFRQGPLSHSSTVSLLGLAVSDLCFCFIVASETSFFIMERFFLDTLYDWNWYPYELINFVASPQEIVLSQIGGGITAFLSMERLFSVMYPFRVKAVFTPKRTCVAIVCIYIGVVLLWGLNSFRMLPEWTWDSEINRSVLSFKEIELSDAASTFHVFTYTMGHVVLMPLGVVVVLICNFIIYWKVNRSKQFRKGSAPTTTHNVSPSCQDPKNPSQEESKEMNSQTTKTDVTYNTNKELKLFRMLTVVGFIYGTVYTLFFIRFMIFHYSRLEIYVDYHPFILNAFLYVINLLQSINASCNIIIYYIMNSRYRKDLQLLFCHWKHRKM